MVYWNHGCSCLDNTVDCGGAAVQAKTKQKEGKNSNKR